MNAIVKLKALLRSVIAFQSIEEITLKQSNLQFLLFLFDLANTALFLQMYLHTRLCLILGGSGFLWVMKGSLTQFLSIVRDNETSVQIPCDIISNNVLDSEQQWYWIGSLLWVAPSARYETFKWETVPSFLPAQGQWDDLSAEQVCWAASWRGFPRLCFKEATCILWWDLCVIS